MKHLLPISLLAAGLLAAAPSVAKVADLLPKPQRLALTAGSPFALGRPVALTDATNSSYLKRVLAANGCTIDDTAPVRVSVEIVSAIPGAFNHQVPFFPDEAYQIEVSGDAIAIKALTATGVTRAAQTLQQLAEGYEEGAAAIEALSLTDWPAFKVRGFMQDIGRSFLSVDELKREIDNLARFKVNVFHWHLTEKTGWRFQVRAYPQLTEAKNQIRYGGQYYTQDECRDITAYAAERGMTVIPEIDMPGHSDVFTRAMGFNMQTDKGVVALKAILDEVCEVFADAPYVHIGGDEVTITYPDFLKTMASYVRDKGRKVVMWNRLLAGPPTADICDMTQMWSTSGRVVSGLPNIDCRYKYTNHFDVYADLVGIYKSNIYYAQQGTAEIAGAISAAWNDTKTPTETDIVRQNNIYANILASVERAWYGGGRQYIETGGTTLPNAGPEYEEFADFERRFLFHKAHSLKDAPIAYVRQSNVRWRVTMPFPNGGDKTLRLPPETDESDVLPETFTYNGQTYRTLLATGAGIYLRHIWHPTVPSFFSNPANNQTAYAWTYVHSPIDQEAGAQIEFYTYSRSGDEVAPPAGAWDRRGSKIWLNGEEIPAPVWQQPDARIYQDNATSGLTNENLTARPVVRVKLVKGWNKVFMRLPHVNNGGTGRDKWQFTFVLTDTEGRNALEGITYSPSKSLDPEADLPASPKLSTAEQAYWYQFRTPLRGDRYPTSQGAGRAVTGTTQPTEASTWKFQRRTDGTFDIVNRADGTYVSPASAHNTALTTAASVPATGWEFGEAATYGYYILHNGTVQFNQTNNAGQGYNIFNWGGGANTTDTGCQYAFTLVGEEGDATGISVPVARPATDGAYYDLLGRKTTEPGRGVYIKDSRKVLF